MRELPRSVAAFVSGSSAACVVAALATGGCASLEGLTGGGGAGAGDAGEDVGSALDGQTESAPDAQGDAGCDQPGNLLTAADDPSFELPGCAPWQPDNATLSSSTVAYCGSYSCQACATARSYGPDLDPSLPVRPGDVYLFSGWVRSVPGGPQVVLHLACHVEDSSGNEVEDIDSNEVTADATWQQFSELCSIVDGGVTLTTLAFHGDDADGGCFLVDQAFLGPVTDGGP